MLRKWLIELLREAFYPQMNELRQEIWRTVDHHENRVMRAIEHKEIPKPVDVPRAFKMPNLSDSKLIYPDFDQAQQENLKQMEEDKHGA